MLTSLRTYRKGVFGGLLIFLISLSMIGFGVEFLAKDAPSNAAVRVDDTEISINDYYKKLNQLETIFQNQFGENYARIAPMLNLQQQTVDQLIQGTLQARFTDSLGMAVGEKAIQDKILSHQFFQGAATQDTYRAFLKALRMSESDLVRQIGLELVNEQLTKTVADLNEPSAVELKAVAREQNRKVGFRYLQFVPATFEPKVDISNQETLKAFYVDTAERYRQPKSIRYIAVPFKAASFVPKVEITEAEIADHFERTSDQYFEERRVTFRQIVLNKKQQQATSLEGMVAGEENKDPAVATANTLQKTKAEEARKRVNDGADFAEVAREVSEDEATKINGGLVGWVTYDQLNAGLREALANLDMGELSSVIETTEAYYLVQVADKEERKSKSFESVKDLVAQALRTELAPEYASAAADAFLEQLNREQSATVTLRSLAETSGYPVISPDSYLSPEITPGEIPAPLAQELLQLPINVRTVVYADDTPFVVEVTDVKESYVPEFEEAKAKVIEAYRKQNATELAKKAAEEALAKLNADPALSFEQLAQTLELSVVPVPEATRTTIQDQLISIPEIKRTAFSLEPKAPRVPSVLEANAGFYLLELASETLPAEADLLKNAQQLVKQESELAGTRIVQVLLATMKAESEVWVNPDVLDDARQR